MTVPTSYTETELRQFMIIELGAVGSILGWDVGTPQVARTVIDALRAYGVTTIASATDAAKLEVLARVAIWRAARRSLAADYPFSADGGRYDRNEVFKQVEMLLREAEIDARVYDSAYQIQTTTAHYDDPYIKADEDDEL